MIKAVIFLARHAETVFNVRKVISGGGSDSELTERGREQARALKKRLEGEGIERVYSSPMGRARRTAELAKPDGLEVEVVEGLTERGFGEAEGRTWAEVDETVPGAKALYRQTGKLTGISGTESFEHAQERIMDAMTRIAEANPGRRVLAVAHGTITRIFMGAIMGIEGKGKDSPGAVNADNCGLNVLSYEGGKFSVELLNDSSHTAF